MIRLSKQEIESLCQTFRHCFLPGDKLWIFGSRINSAEEGGDIDLYIETECQNADQIVDMKLRFLTALKSKIGDQKIDVIIQFGDYSLPIYKIAQEEGIRLL